MEETQKGEEKAEKEVGVGGRFWLQSPLQEPDIGLKAVLRLRQVKSGAEVHL